MTSTSESSEYLISVISDTTNYAGLILASILHQKDLYLNEEYTIYVFYAYKISGYTNNIYILTKLNTNGTVYIYYISI